MDRSCLLVAFLVTSFLILSSSHGRGRKLLESYENEEYATVLLEGSGRDDSREMMELDYEYAGPNNNPKSGLLFPPPPPPFAAAGAPTPTP